jgi:hypothetical protein
VKVQDGYGVVKEKGSDIAKSISSQLVKRLIVELGVLVEALLKLGEYSSRSKILNVPMEKREKSNTS